MKNGDRCKVNPENDNENYDSFRDKVLIVTNVARNNIEHPGYDNSIFPQKLYDFIAEDGTEIHCSLYDYELVKL